MEASSSAERTIPWYGLAMIFAGTCVTTGVLWDISWHATIGRDTFWTPAHLLIYLGGILAGVSCGFLILKTTFAGTPEAKSSSVKIWGMRGPYGAWLAVWGAFAMITSAPFDDWWHNAYGLDVKILSPPHAVLAAGIIAIVYSGVLLALSEQNRNGGNGAVRRMYIYAAGVVITNLAIFLSEYTYPNWQHGARFYIVCAAAFPFLLVSLARAGKVRWPATSVAAVYMAVILFMSWLLQLFAATPKLAPIYLHLDHMAPFGFPLLLIVPAFGIDLVMRRLGERNDWLAAAAIAVVFFALFFVTQWLFSEFLLSPVGDNGIFMGNQIWAYFDRPGPWRHQFWDVNEGPVRWTTIAISLVLAFVSARVALVRGKWLRQVVR